MHIVQFHKKTTRAVLAILASLFILSASSCQSVKRYQRAYLNDRDMVFGSSSVESMEQKLHAYREGAAGAGRGKSSGGCGCR